ncbi:PREDICTED: opioid growth factor receptor-like protein 1 isoform X2 [Nanorana parkeri]|uniref:opioid growth factor receptor-like protein 1 isoform X2 n=1 Tax=Nanorana parkeri TaxID=125878 RepID=UPI000854AC30|nr:PREDICTED: opioid growth factor receptor-like protein 1 isoform X2 [Nanorana parkeri]
MGNLLNGVSFKEPTTVEECDSTWETDSGGEEEQGDEDDEGLESGAEEQGPDSSQNGNTPEQNIKPKRSFYAARDLYKYRHQYPNFKDLRGQNDLCNLRFYMNKIPYKPDGVYIEDILNKWKSDYDKLEHNHTYIQWLFPLREQGLNFYAKELTSYEIEEFKKTKEATKRFIMAYKIMLEFFGLKLVDKNGNVSRAANWQDRFTHLNESQHNYLRITRILKSLGELGYEHYKPPLVKVFLQESIVENTIPNMKQSALEYFVYAIKDRRERRRLLRYAYHYFQPPEHFIWGPPTKQKTRQTKSVQKTTPLNRSLRKHSQKSKDANTEQEQETPTIICSEEKLTGNSQVEETKQETVDVNPSDESAEDFKDKMAAETDDAEIEKSALKHLPTGIDDATNSPLRENELMGHNTEDLSNESNTDSILIVDIIDEGSKDCLCSLSPGSTATAESIIPSEKKLEKEDKAK